MKKTNTFAIVCIALSLITTAFLTGCEAPWDDNDDNDDDDAVVATAPPAAEKTADKTDPWIEIISAVAATDSRYTQVTWALHNVRANEDYLFVVHADTGSCPSDGNCNASSDPIVLQASTGNGVAVWDEATQSHIPSASIIHTQMIPFTYNSADWGVRFWDRHFNTGSDNLYCSSRGPMQISPVQSQCDETLEQGASPGAGLWLVNRAGSYSGDFAVIAQCGASVTGRYYSASYSGHSPSTLTGSLTGNTLTFTVGTSTRLSTYTGTISGNSVTFSGTVRTYSGYELDIDMLKWIAY